MMGNIIRKIIENMKPPTWPIYSWDKPKHLMTNWIIDPETISIPLIEPFVMLTHAHQDAQRTGHCHWCHMTQVKDNHLITGYTHADNCELTTATKNSQSTMPVR